ncbi:MAG TPA: hypothetical protein VGS27_26355 [Candidatus Sulfotelmatobacter sp.]|nr:hypothetical protein [Candidatus Sulfotelmatobacter sp.]
MRKPQTKGTGPSHWDSEVRLLLWLATCVSVLSFLYYFRRGEVLLYGDAVAHINIARRVFDSKTPGLLQLGTVWLPLPHLLMIPFIVSMKMWRTGAGGSIPSMAAYVFGVIGIFRLTRNALSSTAEPDPPARIAAWIAAAVYAANPNLVYMQATAMGESLYLAFFIWAVGYLVEAVKSDPKALLKCGLCLAAACLTRYDGWFLTIAITASVLMYSIWSEDPYHVRGMAVLKGRVPVAEKSGVLAHRGRLIRFLLIAATAPALWLAYNGIVYRNPLEFENGPYSAKAIEKRSQSASNPGHPGSGSPGTAGLYFLKAAQDNMAENQWLQREWIFVLLAAVISPFLTVPNNRKLSASAWPLAFLLIPIPFYALSIAYGGVPIFIPQWWPFTHYNSRYGLQMLPAFATAVALLINFLLRRSWDRRFRAAFIFALLAIAAASYASVWLSTPITLAEARVNMRTRNQLERELAEWLEKSPPDATLLMYLGDHVGAVERAGIPLSHTINEGNHRVWKQPTDPQGLWERALANPRQYADYVLAFDGDPVWQAVHDLHLRELVEIHVTGQARAILYRAR